MAINLPIVSKFDPKGIDQATGALDGFKGSLGKIAGVLAGAFTVSAISNFAKESVLAAEGVATANARIETIAGSMNLFGSETDNVASRLIAFAEANEMVVAVDAEVIKGTQAKLLTFAELAATADDAGGAFDRATIAAIDLAAAGFGTAETNAVQLGKALQDPVKGIGALGRAGVTFTEEQKELIRTMVESGDILGAQEIVLGAIESQVGGTAEATANASEKMTLAFDNIKETAGAALMPAFAALAEAMIPIAEEVAPILGDAISDLTPTLVELAELIPTLVDAFVPLIPTIVDIITFMAELAVELMPIFVEIIGMVMDVIAELLPVFMDFLRDAIMPLIPLVVDLIKQFIPLITDILPILVELIETLLPIILVLIEDLFIPLIPIIVDIIEAFLPLLEKVLPILVDILQDFVIPTLEFLAELLSVILIGAVDFISDRFDDFGIFMEGFAEGFQSVWEGIETFFRNVINGLIGMFEGFVNYVIDGLNNMIRALNGLRFSVPSWVPVIGGQTLGFNIPTIPRMAIPRLAEGGIVMPQPGGVLANIAEAGQAEAVIPLDRLGDFGGGSTYNITVNAGMGTDPVAVGRQVVNAIKRYESVSGKVFASV